VASWGFVQHTRASRLYAVLFGALLSIVVPPATASAQVTVGPDGSSPPQPAEDSAAAHGCSALPDQTRCVEQDGPEAAQRAQLVAPRLLLAVPRLLLRVASGALLLGTDFEDTQHVQHATDLFWNEQHTFGLFPAVFYETGIGWAFGARAEAKNLLHRDELLVLRAGFGGIYEQYYEALLQSDPKINGQRFWFRVAYGLGERDFYGIGNADLAPAASVALPLDAFAPTAAVKAHYRQSELRARAVADSRITRFLRLRTTELWRLRKLSAGDGVNSPPWIDQVYDPATLVGFDRTLVDAYTELDLHLDSRLHSSGDMPPDLPSSGWRMDVWGGAQLEMSRPAQAFGRVGFDLQPILNLYRGNRVLVLRVRGTSVIGDLDRIPFVDLPSLGGSLLLRGYEFGRFRGRATLLTSAEYRYPVQESIAAYLFVDAGRPYAQFSQVSWRSLADLRIGFGIGLDIYSPAATRLRVEVSSSSDGGVFAYLKLNSTDDDTTTYR
jgi:hypothetical protein